MKGAPQGDAPGKNGRVKTPGQRTEAALLQKLVDRVMQKNNMRESDMRQGGW